MNLRLINSYLEGSLMKLLELERTIFTTDFSDYPVYSHP